MKSGKAIQKTTSLIRALAFRAGFCLLFVLLQLTLTAHAQTDQDRSDRRTVETPTLRKKVFSTLSEAQTQAESNQTAEAIATLDRLQSRGGLNSYEAALMWRLYASLYFSQDNYDKAIQAYQNLLNQSDLPEALETEALYSLGQLYFVREAYEGAIRLLDRWFELVTNPNPRAYVFLAQAYYQLGQFSKALEPAQEAVDIVENQGEVPKEDWYMLLRAVHFERNDYAAMARVLERLVRHYPKKAYWIQLSDVYGELNQDGKRLSALEVAYRQNLLDEEKELIKLAQLLLQAEVPYKAARVLGKGIKDGKIRENEDNLLLLANAWSMAQEAEKSLPALIQVANLSNTGEMNLRLGQTYFQLDRLDEAIRSFRQAAKYDGSKDEARRWIEYLEKEKERREQLARN